MGEEQILLHNFDPWSSRKETVEEYLSHEVSPDVAPLYEAFKEVDTPLAETVVLIPVAAEQESDNIYTALEQYAKQTDCEPFTVMMLLNYRADADMSKVERCIDAATQAKQSLGENLDVRFGTKSYEQPVIGEVRKDLWDTALLLAQDEGQYDTSGGEVYAINHDIDTVSIHSHYIRNVHNYYHKKDDFTSISGLLNRGQGPAYTQVSHDYPFETHPNTAKGIYWIDTVFRLSENIGGYDEGVVIPLSFYAEKHGFDAKAKNGETFKFTKDMRFKRTIGGTAMKTSPRRYVERFPQYGYDKIWTTDSFTSNDICREGMMQRDATHEELERHVLKSNELYSTIITEFGVQKVFQRLAREAPYFSPSQTDEREQYITEAEQEIHRRLSLKFAMADRALASMGVEKARLDFEEAFAIKYKTSAYVAGLRNFLVKESQRFTLAG